jgi:hypothetical protein
MEGFSIEMSETDGSARFATEIFATEALSDSLRAPETFFLCKVEVR